jgi:hypothetical protein
MDGVAVAKQVVLKGASFGARVAEEEVDQLADYFVETDQWERLLQGDVDIVYGPKGSGKSALYSLLIKNADGLFDRGVVVIPAEQPRGAPAFKDIVNAPPTSEAEFIALWKLYLLCLIAELLREYGVETKPAKRLLSYLQDAHLVADERSSLEKLVGAVRDYARRILAAEAVEGGATIDPSTGMITGITGRILLSQPTADLTNSTLVTVDSLFADADVALAEVGFSAWLALDRLDVAFADHDELEANALRALFKVYLDLLAHSHVTLKIFLRSDIWRRIMDEGFREASHITRHLTISWDRNALLNLVVRRVLQNPTVRTFYAVDNTEDVLSNLPGQKALYARVFPDQVDAGPNKPTSFDWMLSRTRDATGETAPRELIHLLSSLRESQLRRFELGHEDPPLELLFDRAAFKEALPEVSKVRLEQTLYAEYASFKDRLERLDQQKTQQTIESLGRIWELSEPETRVVADQLAEIGFFERRSDRDRYTYWVPFLYRDALRMVQGSAETVSDDEESTSASALQIE